MMTTANKMLLVLALAAVGALACTSDADCGGADQLGFCDVGSGVCQCGVGFEGDLAVDPTACSFLCAPPPVADSVAFLNEPVIGMEAVGGNLELTVDMDVNLKQVPTTMALVNPVSGAACDILPSLLGSGLVTQSVDEATCDVSYLYRNAFGTEVGQACWETLAETSEAGAQYAITFASYKTMVEVVQEGLAPFGQAATRDERQDETTIARLFRRNYTISVATRFQATNQEFAVLADGVIRYRLVEIDYDLLGEVIRVTVETQTSDEAKLANTAFDALASSNLAPVTLQPSAGACEPSSPAGFCNQFHVMEFSDEPCSVVGGEIVLDVELQCADGSDPSTCGFTNLPAGNIFTLDNLLVEYDACPVVITYGVDAAASYLRLHEDVLRANPLSVPTVIDSVYYGQLSIEPAGDALFQAATLTSLKVHQVSSPSNVDLGDQLPSSFLTLVSPATSTDPNNPLWNFDLLVDGAFFQQAESYFLEATVDLVFANTGALTRTLRFAISPNAVVKAVRQDGGAAEENEAQEGILSSTFRLAAVEMDAEAGKEEEESGGSNTALIAAAVGIGIAALAAVVIVVVVVVSRRRRRRREEAPPCGDSSDGAVEHV